MHGYILGFHYWANVCDIGASRHARIPKEDKRWIRGKPINWHVLKPIMALEDFKDDKNVMNPKGPIKDLRIFDSEIWA